MLILGFLVAPPNADPIFTGGPLRSGSAPDRLRLMRSRWYMSPQSISVIRSFPQPRTKPMSPQGCPIHALRRADHQAAAVRCAASYPARRPKTKPFSTDVAPVYAP